MAKSNVRGWLLATSVFAGVAGVAGAAPAFAQQAEEVAQVGDIVVTGSRIRQKNLVTTSPVTQVSAEDIDVQGVTRVEDLVTQLPQAFAAQNSTVANGASGTATVSLRNLGADRTLVLIDGKRMGYGSPTDSAADLNQIPGQMVERVEVLTGGASAVYGSDAIAGVVNFIMRRNFEGIEIDAQYGFNHHNNDYDGPGNLRNVIEGRAQTSDQFKLPDDDVTVGFSREVNIMMGVNAPDDRGNITLYAGYRKNNKILQRDFDYSACAIAAPLAASPNDYQCSGSSTAFPGRFTDFAGGYDFTLDGSGNFIDWNTARDAYNFGPLNYFQRPDERYTLGAFGHYQVNDKVELYTQLMFSDYSTVAQIAPSGNFFGEFANGFRTTDGSSTMSCATPFLSAQQLGAIQAAGYCSDPTEQFDIYIGRRNIEGGGRQSDLSFQNFRGVIGARGELDEGWTYDFSAQYQRVKQTQIYRNEFSNTRLARALDVVRDGNGNIVCSATLAGIDGDCVPYNVFAVGGVTAEALEYLQVPLISTGWTEQQVVSMSFAVDLGVYGIKSPWAESSIQTAFGAEYRRDALDLTPDVGFQTGDGAGQGGPTLGLSGSNQVIDVFGEAQIPLVEGMQFADQISLDLAYRHSEYELGGGTDSWKIGADWAPSSDLRFRASLQAAVRAPNVIELFTAQGLNLFDMPGDPCVGATGTLQASCIATGVPASYYDGTNDTNEQNTLNSPAGQYNFMQGGNPALTPEDSETFTLGVVFTPSFIPGLNVSIDYFNIEIENLVSSVGAMNTLAACYTNNEAAACDNINRNANGQLWVGTGYVSDLASNIGGLSTAGIDFNVGYRYDLGERGSLGFALVGTWLDELVTDTGLGYADSVYDCAGFFGSQCGTPNPDWRHRFRVDYSPNDAFTINGTWRYMGEVEQASLGADGSLNNHSGLDRYFDAANYFDLAATWRVRNNVTLRAGVNNVFDRDPPLSPNVGTTGNGNTYPQSYDAMGRYVFFGVTANF